MSLNRMVNQISVVFDDVNELYWHTNMKMFTNMSYAEQVDAVSGFSIEVANENGDILKFDEWRLATYEEAGALGQNYSEIFDSFIPTETSDVECFYRGRIKNQDGREMMRVVSVPKQGVPAEPRAETVEAGPAGPFLSAWIVSKEHLAPAAPGNLRVE